MPCLWQDIWEQNLMLVPATDRARDKNQETIQPVSYTHLPLKKAPLPYGRRASIIGAYFTFTVTFTDLFPDFTVTFAVPFFFPVMTPFLETVTIFLLEVV